VQNFETTSCRRRFYFLPVCTADNALINNLLDYYSAGGWAISFC